MENIIRYINKKNYLLKKVLKPFYLILGLRYIRIYKKKRDYKNNSAEVLLRAKEALDGVGVFFWLDFGTLLGAVREGGFISHDTDLDISVFLSDYTCKIEESMIKHGFSLLKQYEIDGGEYGLEQTYEYKGVSFDIFYHSNHKESYTKMQAFVPFVGCSYEESLNEKGGLMVIEQYLPKNGFDSMQFLGEKFNIPSKVDEYLKYHYGEDFMIPKKWDYKDLEKDNKNAVILEGKIGKIKKI